MTDLTLIGSATVVVSQAQVRPRFAQRQRVPDVPRIQHTVPTGQVWVLVNPRRRLVLNADVEPDL